VPDFFTQVVWFHLVRAPDGDESLLVRLREMFLARSVLPLVLLALSASALWRRRSDPFFRQLLAVSLSLVGAFLGAAAFWNQYDAHLAFPLAMLCGAGVAERWNALAPRFGVPVVGLVVALLVAIPGFVWVRDRRFDRDERQPSRVALIRAAPSGPMCAFEPHELVMADRWPATLVGTKTLVDSYGQMLLDAARGGAQYPSATAAFSSEAAQTTARQQLPACPRWVVGWRGRWQLHAASQAQLQPEQVVDP